MCADEVRFECVGGGRVLEVLFGDGGELEVVFVGVVVVGFTVFVVFDEGRGAEVF